MLALFERGGITNEEVGKFGVAWISHKLVLRIRAQFKKVETYNH